MKFLRSLFILILVFSPVTLANQLPASSVYHFDSAWMNQNSQTREIVELRGEARLVAFIYTYCEHTCPLIISKIKDVLHSLPRDLATRMPVTLITLDPVRDTPDQMKAYLLKNSLNEKQWEILTDNKEDIRVLSNLFGVKYKAMSKDELAHSNVITLLDADGVILSQLRGLNEDKKSLIDKIISSF
jgi:protein SCO1/2